MQCPCNPQNLYATCCEPLHLGTHIASTPLQLMRSRYSAYAMRQIDYLIHTTHISTRKLYPRASIVQWANSTKFTKLTILNAEGDIVEFEAQFSTNNKPMELLHERSVFVLEQGVWYYTQGEHLR